jgi:hypothetical protein
MEHIKTIDDRRGQRRMGRRATAGLRAGLAALSLASLGMACPAAESMSGLGAAFRPQGGGDAQAQGSGARTEANQSGLRVVVSGTSRAVASIDGQIVHVGDIVNGMRVTRINAQGVVLTGEGGETEQLMVNPSAVKRKPAAGAPYVSKGARQ